MIVSHSIEIARPFAVTWGAFDEPARQPEWLTMMKSFQQIKGDGNELGAIQNVVFVRDSGDTELTVTILDYDENGRVAARYEGMQLPFILRSTFTELGAEATEWSAVIDVKLNLVQKALTPVLKGTLGGLAEDMGSDFKKYVEGI